MTGATSTSFARQLAAAYLLENRYLSKVIPVLGAIVVIPLDHPWIIQAKRAVVNTPQKCSAAGT
jgi:hypothetical protein